MGKIHPSEVELEQAGEGVEEHLRGCVRCRSAVADYRWLGGEIGAALAQAAQAVRVPRPKWGAVQGRMVALQQRQAVGWRASAAACAMVAISLMLLVSPVLGSAAAWTLSPEQIVARAPVTAAASSTSVASGVTPTPVASLGETPTPALVLPPTPPEPGTRGGS